MPDREGRLGDIVLGFDNPLDYLTQDHPYFGALIGRYANRIKHGSFILNGKTYQLKTNSGAHHLHGGMKGFDKVWWECEQSDQQHLTLKYTSPDKEEGYPGNLKVKVIYTLNEENEFRIDYKASSDKATHLNLTHHSYFNLNNNKGEKIHGHELKIEADSLTEVDQDLIPTGKLIDLNSLMDFRLRRPIGHLIDYDHNYVLKGERNHLRKVAELYEPNSGRLMEVFTTEPGLQFYSGNFLNGTLKGKEGHYYHRHQGLCLEAQHFPDSPNQPNFPNTLLLPGDIYRQTTIYKFNVSDRCHPYLSQL